jgi:hypothetical protein
MAVRMILAVESETDLLVANPLGELWPLRSLPRMGNPPSGSLAVRMMLAVESESILLVANPWASCGLLDHSQGWETPPAAVWQCV